MVVMKSCRQEPAPFEHEVNLRSFLPYSIRQAPATTIMFPSRKDATRIDSTESTF